MAGCVEETCRAYPSEPVVGIDGLAETGGVAEEAIELGIFNRFFDGLRLAGVVNAIFLDSISAISVSKPDSSLVGTYIKTFS